DIGGEVDRPGDRLQLHLDARLLTRVLHDGLVFLARCVDRRLVYEIKPLTILRADAIGPALPTCRVEHPIRFVDIELPRCVLGAEAFGAVKEIAGSNTGASVNVV